jgi:hypothetical protein
VHQQHERPLAQPRSASYGDACAGSGDRDRVLAPGQATDFSTWLPHWTGAVDEAVVLLVVFRPDG